MILVNTYEGGDFSFLGGRGMRFDGLGLDEVIVIQGQIWNLS